jgi:ribosomal protein S18 acetylase RimI-like enzyme
MTLAYRRISKDDAAVAANGQRNIAAVACLAYPEVMSEFTIDLLTADDAEAFRDIRLEGLQRNPEAFGASFEDECDRSVEHFAASLETGMVFGAWSISERQLLAVMGLRIPAATKLKHKATLWGVYVRPQARGLGVASALLAHVLDQAEPLVEGVNLTVGAANQAAIRLYSRAGFIQYGLERRSLKVGDIYHDEMLMTRP